MHIKELIKQIKVDGWTKIVVIGAEGSGTTISAYIMAKTLKFLFVREDHFGRLDYAAFLNEIKTKNNFVCQCPSLTSFARSLPPDVLVIAVNRDLSDTLITQMQIGFQYEEREIRMYADHKIFDMDKSLAILKYEFIEMLVARDRVVEYVDYVSLESHKLYLDRNQRRLLRPGQIIPKKKTPAIFDFAETDKK